MYPATDPAQVRMEHLAQDRREANIHDLAKALATAHDELAAAYAGAHADFNRAVEEIERLREQLDRCNAERQRLAEELDDARAETQEIAAELAQERTAHERTLAVLREVLGHFDDKGSIGAIKNVVRSCWVTVTKVDGWRNALTPAAEAGDHRD